MIVPSRMYKMQGPIIPRHTNLTSQGGANLTMSQLPKPSRNPIGLDSIMLRDVRKTSLSINHIKKAIPSTMVNYPQKMHVAVDNRSSDQKGDTYQPKTKLESRMI